MSGLVSPMLYSATSTDNEVMAAIHAAAFTGPDAWSRDVFSLQLALSNVFGLLHASGGMVLARVAADEAEILTLAVIPSMRRGGIGRMLLGEATTRAFAMGARTVFLEVSIMNSAALALYTQTGFVKVGRRPHYYLDKSDALVLRLNLDQRG